jgi:hypothetical protein
MEHKEQENNEFNLHELDETFNDFLVVIKDNLNSFHEKELKMWWEGLKKGGKKYRS